MSEKITVQEIIESIKPAVGERGRFNKKKFTTLMKALANDIEFQAKVAKVKKGELESVESIMVTKGFREWCKKLLEKAGVDKNESNIVLSSDFTIDNMDGLYEFFVTAIYEYINSGNQFDFLPTEDFKGSIYIKNVPEKVSVTDAYSPQDRTYLGTFETTKKAHKELGIKSGCPAFLKNKKPVPQDQIKNK